MVHQDLDTIVSNKEYIDNNTAFNTFVNFNIRPFGIPSFMYDFIVYYIFIIFIVCVYIVNFIW